MPSYINSWHVEYWHLPARASLDQLELKPTKTNLRRSFLQGADPATPATPSHPWPPADAQSVALLVNTHLATVHDHPWHAAVQAMLCLQDSHLWSDAPLCNGKDPCHFRPKLLQTWIKSVCPTLNCGMALGHTVTFTVCGDSASLRISIFRRSLSTWEAVGWQGGERWFSGAGGGMPPAPRLAEEVGPIKDRCE